MEVIIMKRFLAFYVNKNAPTQTPQQKHIQAESKKWIRTNWNAIMNTEDYIIKRIDELIN